MVVASSRLTDLQALLPKVSGQAKRNVLREIRIEKLRGQIRGCRACPLGNQRHHSVPWSGPVDGKADLMLIGEAPGATEDSQGVPFVGRSGQLLDRLLLDAGTSRERSFVANTLCCRPPENRDPRAYELNACKPNFNDQLQMSGLWLGVALGGYAIANVLGKPRASISVGEAKETPYWKDGRIWLTTYHPAYAIKNIDARREIVGTLRWAMAIRVGDINIPRPDFAELRVSDGGGRDIGSVIKKKGWALLYSATLGTKIVLLKDITHKAKVPRALDGIGVYTVEEWLKVGEIGPKRGGWTRDELRRLHFVKTEMGGEIVVG